MLDVNDLASAGNQRFTSWTGSRPGCGRLDFFRRAATTYSSRTGRMSSGLPPRQVGPDHKTQYPVTQLITRFPVPGRHSGFQMGLHHHASSTGPTPIAGTTSTMAVVTTSCRGEHEGEQGHSRRSCHWAPPCEFIVGGFARYSVESFLFAARPASTCDSLRRSAHAVDASEPRRPGPAPNRTPCSRGHARRHPRRP